MNVLVVGSGAREHALVWKLASSPRITRLYAAPGNPGMARWATLAPLRADDVGGVVAFCASAAIELVVVGPEVPLMLGLADALRAQGVQVFGPSAAAARLEGSKAFAKEVMRRAGIPTADYAVFGPADDAEAYARSRGACVIKADGLAAGKGVVVAGSGEEAAHAVADLRRQLGAAAGTLVIEERLEGEEVSVIALSDGDRFTWLPTARDHKRLSDGDQGPNTGGMGAYAPASILDPAALERVGTQVMEPALRELSAQGTPFIGALYAGLMVGPREFKVLEFNARFGDPECQVLLPLLDEDLLPWLEGAARGALPAGVLALKAQSTVGVVLASEGYPASPRAGDAIMGIEAAEAQGAQVFHAGTRVEGGALVTAGGRVLTVCGSGPDRATAASRAYAAAELIHFRGRHLRRDIARAHLGSAPTAPGPTTAGRR